MAQDIKPIGEFKAVYNPYNRRLAVKYGSSITTYKFEEEEEWVAISYNADEDHPNYLHIQLDYDLGLQLLFYPRVEDSESFNEGLGTYFYSGRNEVPSNIRLCFNDKEFNYNFRDFLGCDDYEWGRDIMVEGSCDEGIKKEDLEYYYKYLKVLNTGLKLPKLKHWKGWR